MIDSLFEWLGFAEWPSIPWIVFVCAVSLWILACIFYCRICDKLGIADCCRFPRRTIGTLIMRPARLLKHALIRRGDR